MPKHPLGLRVAARPKMTNRVLGASPHWEISALSPTFPRPLGPVPDFPHCQFEARS